MTPLDRLDFVLKWYTEDQNDKKSLELYELYDLLKMTYSDANKYHQEWHVNKLHQVLEKLMKDGYIRHSIFEKNDGMTTGISSPYKVDRYSLTFEGEVFYQQGGYKNKSAYESIEISRRKFYDEQIVYNAKRLNVLTFALVIATLGLIAWDMWKFYHR